MKSHGASGRCPRRGAAATIVYLLLPLAFGMLMMDRWIGNASFSSVCNKTVASSHDNGPDSVRLSKVRTGKNASGMAIVGAFNHQRDAFKNSQVPVNATLDYIGPWYQSLQTFPSIQGVVLHNMFSLKQQTQWTTPQIQFVEIDKNAISFRQSKSRPINDM